MRLQWIIALTVSLGGGGASMLGACGPKLEPASPSSDPAAPGGSPASPAPASPASPGGGGGGGGGAAPPANAHPATCQPGLRASYSKDIKPILDRYCTACHAANTPNRRGAPDTVNYDTYPAASAAALLGNTQIQSGEMPPGKALSNQDKCMFDNWVQSNLSP